MKKRPYPNDRPQHLQDDAAVNPIFVETPVGCHTLDFTRMDSVQFEQFCWWLLRKDFNLMGCQLIGASGHSQGGIDLFAHDKLRPEQLVVFECKCWRKLTATELKATIARFMNGAWCEPGTRYVLIVAQENLGTCALTWKKESAKLREKGIECEFWTAVHLTKEVQRFPDIIAKFFTPAAAQTFGNEWMQKVGFIERLHKAMTDERAEVREVAYQYLKQTATTRENIEEIRHVGNSWQIDLPWVHLHALLPDKHTYPGSASIEIKKADTAGLLVVLSQRWFLNKLAGGQAAPLASPYRPFLVGKSNANKSDDAFVIDLENCRLSLPAEGLEELAYVADKFSAMFIAALEHKEKSWGAEDFPFIGKDGPYVAICTVPAWLWQKIMDFAWAHDADAGDSEWHIFDKNRHHLKVLTTKPHVAFDLGYHGIFYPRKNLEEISFKEDIVLVWQPPMAEDDCEARKWMFCGQALQWLTGKLLPAVGNWLEERGARQKGLFGRQKYRQEFAIWWRDNAEIRDLRTPPLLKNQRYRHLGLMVTLGELQSELHVESRRIYLTTAQIKALYQALLVILQGGFGYAGYIASNLGIKASSHQEIIVALHGRIEQEELTINNFSLDCVLRAFREALKDDDTWLDATSKQAIFTALTPIMEFVDMCNLFKRHTKWL